jgi:hypothetical protein
MHMDARIVGAPITFGGQHMYFYTSLHEMPAEVIRIGRLTGLHRRVGCRDNQDFHAGIHPDLFSGE